MFVVVQHTVKDPASFWGLAQQGVPNLPPHLKLHHCFPASDGTRAVCVWEADSVQAVKEFFRGELDRASSNEFYPVENKEGVALPSAVVTA